MTQVFNTSGATGIFQNSFLWGLQGGSPGKGAYDQARRPKFNPWFPSGGKTEGTPTRTPLNFRGRPWYTTHCK